MLLVNYHLLRNKGESVPNFPLFRIPVGVKKSPKTGNKVDMVKQGGSMSDDGWCFREFQCVMMGGAFREFQADVV